MSNLDEKDMAVKLAAINLQKALNAAGRNYAVHVDLRVEDVTTHDDMAPPGTNLLYQYVIRVTKPAVAVLL